MSKATTNISLDNLIKKAKTNIGDIKNDTKTGTLELIAGNYVVMMAILISFFLFMIIYFTSKTFRVGRTISTLQIYQKFQELQSFPYNRFGDAKLCQVKVASAYNAASNIYQMLDYTSTDLILIRLQSGARYLEFNVFNDQYGEKAEPVVSMGYKKGEWKMTLNEVTMNDVFGVIANNAFKLKQEDAGVPNPEDPIFIGLNLNTNNNIACLNRLAGYLHRHFKNRLLPNEFSFQSSEDLPEVKLHQLMEKVVIFASDGFQGSHLEELVNYSWDNIEESNNHMLKRMHYTDFDSYDFSSRDLIEFNKKGLTIVVPNKEGDYSSNNFNPIKPFELGCQFVAMNYQTIDTLMDTYITEFKNASLVLKPKDLR
jgi:hypothetical protein